MTLLTYHASGGVWRRYGGTDIQPGTLTDQRYQLGMATVNLLDRVNKIAPNTAYTTQFGEASPTANRTYDFRGSSFSSYHDADAIYPTLYYDAYGWVGRFTAPDGTSLADSHTINQRPVRLGNTTPGSGIGIIGGVVVGDQPETLTWIDMKHGSYIQSLIDSGTDPDVAWNQILNNANQDGDARFHIAADSWGVVDGMRCRNTHDGFGIYGNGDRVAAGNVYVRNVWFQDVHDDAIENDEQRTLHVFDSLFERCYTFLSTRATDTSGTPTNNVQTIENCIVRLWPFPGGYKLPSTEASHDLIYKMQSNSPALHIKDTLIASSDFRDPGGTGPQLPERSVGNGDSVTDTYENVTLCWLGTGGYPGNVPAGCILLTGSAAQDAYDAAVGTWKARHGVTDFQTVDMDKMLNPDPLPEGGV